MQKAMAVADAHGYKNVSLTHVEGKGRASPGEVLVTFYR